jgi:hypothetical protein
MLPTIVVTCQILVADAQETDLVLDPEMKEAAGMTGVASRELLLHNQEASIRESMRHEIVLKKNENCRVKYFLKIFMWLSLDAYLHISAC